MFNVQSSDFENSELKVDGNKAFIENENLRIDYTNDENGMRQDFIMKKKQNEEGKLRLQLSAYTKLKMTIGADALVFKDNSMRRITSFKFQVTSFKFQV